MRVRGRGAGRGPGHGAACAALPRPRLELQLKEHFSASSVLLQSLQRCPFLMEKRGSERTPLQPPGTARRWSGAFGSSLVPVNRSVIALGLMAPRALGEPVVQDEVVPICA